MLQVRLHRGQRNLRKHELGAAQLRRTSVTKGAALFEACLRSSAPVAACHAAGQSP